MMKIDTHNGSKLLIDDWREFEISRLFTIKSPAKRSIKIYDEGEIPYVSSGSVNNGIVSYLMPKKGEKLESGNCITVSPLDGSSFYQDEDFLGRGGAGSAISLLYNTELSRYSALFICTIIKKASQRFNYCDALTSDNLKTLRIKLPILHNKDGSTYVDEKKKYADEGFVPDWRCMEDYMKKLAGRADETIAELKKVNLTKLDKIDTSKWREYPIADFFDFSLPKGDLQVKKVLDGDIPLITPSNANNGLHQRISASSQSTLYDANTLTVDMFGNAYYQEENYFVTAHGHVNVLVPRIKMNKYIGWFLASTIKKMFMNKYGFADMCTQKVLKREVISIPIDDQGNPDWNYMEEYMKKMEAIAQNNVRLMNISKRQASE